MCVSKARTVKAKCDRIESTYNSAGVAEWLTHWP